MDYSSQESVKKLSHELGKKQKKDQSSDKSERDDRDRYGSVMECYSPTRKSNECYSLEQKLSAESERSSGKNVGGYRKDSKDIGMEHSNASNHHFQPIPKKQSANKIDLNNDKDYKNSDDYINKNHHQHKDKQSIKSSSSSSN